ncbi:MAG: hypothetical protein AAFV78_05555, partial [Bacteroidota bacterium]
LYKMKNIVFFLSVFIYSSQIFANGGPVNWSDVVSTGAVQMMKEARVSIETEHLHIYVSDSESLIDVTYYLQVAEPLTVDYGFPVDYVEDEANGGFNWHTDYVSSFFMYLNDETLNSQTMEEPELKKEVLKSIYGQGEREVSVKRRWYFSKMKFDRAGTHVLRVVYKLKNYYSDAEYSKSSLRSYSMRMLNYDLSPARAWGNGVIGRFRAEISGLNLPTDLIALSGVGVWSEQNGKLVWGQEDLKIDEKQRFGIVYNPSTQLRSQEILRKKLSAWAYDDISASSSLSPEATYGPKNLIDGNMETAWVEGASGLGIGESIEITLSFLKDIRAIFILPGYTKSQKAYEENARPQKIKVAVYIGEKGKGEWREMEEISLQDRRYQTLMGDNIAALAQPIMDIGDVGDWNISKIRLTITAVYPGTKYDDTCISEVLLLENEW